MKYLYTVFCFFVFNASDAQYKLSGSFYQENFNGLSTGLPEGWQIDTNVKSGSTGGSALGTFVSTPGTTTRWTNSTGGFKNVASANGFTSFADATAALQFAATDRAPGVRQTGSFGDPGASFTFRIDNTFRLSDFELDFRIQSLDSSNGSKVTSWEVQYGLGELPTVFTTVSGGAFTTGGNTFSNVRDTVYFGSALDDIRTHVWIRIVSLTAAAGSGSRTTTAIDDIALRWTGTAVPDYRPLVQVLFPAKGATGVVPGSILSVDFSRNISLGLAGSVRIKNETDHTVQTISAGSSFLSASGKKLLISGVRLEPSKTYHVTFDSTIADTAARITYGIEDTTEWRFSTSSKTSIFGFELFDSACAKGGSLPVWWTKFSGFGAEEWNCDEHTPGNSAMRIHGNDGTANTDNEDWLISPLINMSSPDAMGIAFRLYKLHSGPELQVLVSHTYAGSGSPDSASWTPVTVMMSAADIGKWMHYMFPIAAFKSKPFHVGFKYTSNTGAAYDIRIDSFMTMIKTGIESRKLTEGQISVTGHPRNGHVDLQLTGIAYGEYQLELFNTFGQRIWGKQISVASPIQRFLISDINLAQGMYVVRLGNDKRQLLQKFTIQ